MEPDFGADLILARPLLPSLGLASVILLVGCLLLLALSSQPQIGRERIYDTVCLVRPRKNCTANGASLSVPVLPRMSCNQCTTLTVRDSLIATCTSELDLSVLSCKQHSVCMRLSMSAVISKQHPLSLHLNSACCCSCSCFATPHIMYGAAE